MKNLKTLVLFVGAVGVIVASLVVSQITTLSVSDAFAYTVSPRILRDEGGSGGGGAKPNAPKPEASAQPKPTPKPEASAQPKPTPKPEAQAQPKPKPTTSIVTAQPVTTSTSRTGPDTGTTRPTQNSPALTENKPPQRSGDTPPPQNTPRTSDQPTKQPTNPGVYKVDCPINTIFSASAKGCVSNCPGGNKAGCLANLCDTSKGLIYNERTKQCEKPVNVKCPDGKPAVNGKCELPSESKCLMDGITSKDADKCCSKRIQDGRCSRGQKPPVTDPGNKCLAPGGVLKDGFSCCGLSIEEGKCVTPKSNLQPTPAIKCPPVYRWCNLGDSINLGAKSGMYLCSNIFVSQECGTIKTLVPYNNSSKV